jgi:hypothetical protein
MTWSANEVMTLASKAARGAGAPPAQAYDFGRATVCHIQAGRDLTAIQQALDALPDGPIMDLPIAFMRVLECEGGQITSQLDPKGWLPLAQSYVDASAVAMEAKTTGTMLHITADLQTPARKAPLGRITLPDDLSLKMTNLAARILVPESDASRLAGAGAGLTDND